MNLSSAVLFSASPVVSAGLAFLTVPMMTWTLTDQVIAEFGLFQYASTVLLLLVTCGMDQAFLRELSACEAPGALLRKCLVPCVAMLAITAVGVLSSGLLLKECGITCSISSWLVPWLFINVGLMVVQRFSAQKARISQQGGAYLIAETVLKLPLAMVFLGSFLMSEPVPPDWPILLLVSGTAAGTSVLVARNQSLWRTVIVQQTDKTVPTLKQLVKFGFPLALASVMYWALTSFGAYLTQILHGPTETARLVVATSLSNVSAIGQAIFSLLWLPVLYRKLDEGVTPEYISQIARLVTMGSVLGFAVIACVLFIAQNLLGEKFRDIAPIATAICVLPLLYIISEVTFVGLLVKRKSFLSMLATFSALSVSVLLNAMLVPDLAAVGVAIAIAASAFIFLIARTEFSGHAWFPVNRKYIYFGGGSICFSGIISAGLPANWVPIVILFLIPYIFCERKLIQGIAIEFKKKISCL
jgi:O-antigen/teichoic acid export membrane protein